MNAFIIALVQLLHTLFNLYIWIVIIASIISFIRPDPNHPIVQTLYKLTEPLFSYIRKKIPFIVISGVDLSPIVIILGLQFADTFMMNSIAV